MSFEIFVNFLMSNFGRKLDYSKLCYIFARCWRYNCII